MLAAVRAAGVEVERREWEPVRELLSSVSRSRATQGFTPSRPRRSCCRSRGRSSPGCAPKSARMPTPADELWNATVLLDSLGLYTTEVYQKAREEVIARQQEEMLELSTPVVKLWDGILALPMIGTLDSTAPRS